MSESNVLSGFIASGEMCQNPMSSLGLLHQRWYVSESNVLSGFIASEVVCVRIQCPLWLCCNRGEMCQNPVSSLTSLHQRG